MNIRSGRSAARALIMRCLRAPLLATAILAAIPAGAQTWNNPGTGDWFDPNNWVPAAIPVAGGVVIVSNGGVATLAAPNTTPLLGSLSIGLAGSGTEEGTVVSNGVAIGTSGGIFVGFSSGAAAAFEADGTFVVTNASVQAGSASFGAIFGATVAGSATGLGNVSGALGLSGGPLSVGQTLLAARGSEANGTLNVGGDAGTSNFLTVGSTFPTGGTETIGTVATGALTIGGDIGVVSGGLAVGGAFSVRDGAFFDTATGTVSIGGTLAFMGTSTLSIGLSGGGIGVGHVSANAIDFTGGRAEFVNIGVASNEGNAVGSLTAMTGGMNVGQTTNVGTASATSGLPPPSANGALDIGGALLCVSSCGALNVGTAAGDGVATAVGSVSTGGVGGFGSYNVGFATGTAAGSSATGALVSTGTDPAGTTNSVFIGSVFAATGATSAQGTMSVGGSLLLNGGSIVVGETLSAERGSSASGSLAIGGDAGTATFAVVGAIFAFDASEIGTQATGSLAIGGNLTLVNGSFTVGAFANRAGDAIDVAHGAATIDGTLALVGLSTLSIGVSSGGIATGSLDIGTIDASAGQALMSGIGIAANGGTATGRFTATSGDLRTTQSGLTVGGATGGPMLPASADGSLLLGGALTCVANCGNLTIGSGAGGGLLTATGAVEAAAVSGYVSYTVGVLGGGAAGSRVEGSLTVGAGGLASGVVGGNLAVGLGLNGNAAGSVVEGLLDVSGNAGSYTVVRIGNGVASGASHTGTLELTGGALGTQFTIIGVLSDTFISTASADGTLRVASGQVIAAGPGAATAIGFTNSAGSATGRLLATDSTLSLGTMSVGGASMPGSTATGIIELISSTLAADSLSAGHGSGGSALLSLAGGSTMTVSGDVNLANAVLRLDDSFVDVAGVLSLADATTLEFDIDGLLRGDEYGAIDAVAAALNGTLVLSFDDLVPVGDLMTFDLIVSGSATGINGDFDALSFGGLPTGFSLLAGVVLDGVEIYRVTLLRNQVDEPATIVLMLVALAALAVLRRRASTGAVRTRYRR